MAGGGPGGALEAGGGRMGMTNMQRIILLLVVIFSGLASTAILYFAYPDLPPSDDPVRGQTNSFMVIGNWGLTPGGDSSKDIHSQLAVKNQMVSFATTFNSSFVVNLGNSFYWAGIHDLADTRWKTGFENVYTNEAGNFSKIPWYGTMGTHDYGGGNGLCGPSVWQRGELCDSPDAVAAAIDKKFTTQRDHHDSSSRWNLDHFYRQRFTYYDDKGPYLVDLFVVDTNYGGSSLDVICCQCNSISAHTCTKPVRNSTDLCVSPENYTACSSYLEKVWNDGMAFLERELVESNATWKIVANHYLLYELRQTSFTKVLSKGKPHLVMGGHDSALSLNDNTTGHFLEIQSGAGGGSQLGKSTGSIWHNSTFGFYGVTVTRDKLRLLPVSSQGVHMHCYDVVQIAEALVNAARQVGVELPTVSGQVCDDSPTPPPTTPPA